MKAIIPGMDLLLLFQQLFLQTHLPITITTISFNLNRVHNRMEHSSNSPSNLQTPIHSDVHYEEEDDDDVIFEETHTLIMNYSE